jgi:hypothetical protein
LGGEEALGLGGVVAVLIIDGILRGVLESWDDGR